MDNVNVESEKKFGRVKLSDLKDSIVRFTPRGKGIVIHTHDGNEYIFVRRGLSQLIKLLGVRKEDLVRKRDVIFKRDDVYADYYVGRDGFYVYRVVTEEYIPVRHSVLFETVEERIKSLGYQIIDVEFIKYTRRTAKIYYVFVNPLPDVGDSVRGGLYISNANTASDAIRLYAYFSILSCRNGLIETKLGHRVAIAHRGESVDDILKRVRVSVDLVLSKIFDRHLAYKERLIKLQDTYIDLGMLNNWRQDILFWLSQKYLDWFDKILRKNIDKYGNTQFALYQTLTYFVPRIGKYSTELAERFNREAMKMLVSTNVSSN